MLSSWNKDIIIIVLQKQITKTKNNSIQFVNYSDKQQRLK